ncbi:MAG: MFS transporter [Alphaproteobacteria bacterium]
MANPKATVGLLAVCQAFFTSSSSIMALTTGLVGFQFLGEDTTLATVPVSAMVVGTALATAPASMIMKRVGRRAGFTIGAAIGVLGAAVAALSVWQFSFWGFSFGILLMGMYNGFAHYYRFAAADVSSEAFRGRAISLVLFGGVVAAFVGPEIALRTANLVPGAQFLGTYLAVIVLVTVSIALIQFIRIPAPTAQEQLETGRPLSEIARQPKFIVAVLSSMIGFAVMVLLMTATPIAMVEQFHHALSDAKTVIQWHALAMFAPSFITGALITRFGVLNIIGAGVVFMVGAIVFAVTGVAFLNFWAALFLLGLGWNFMFVGGSTLLTQTYTPAERAKAQGFHDFMVFGLVALASLSSGALLQLLSWRAVSFGAVPFLIVVTLALVWLLLRRPEPAKA